MPRGHYRFPILTSDDLDNYQVTLDKSGNPIITGTFSRELNLKGIGKLGNNIAGVTGSEQLTNVHEIYGDELTVTTATVTSGHIGHLTSALDADASDISGVNHFEADSINTALSASLNAGGFDIDNINTLAAATANIGQLAADLDGTTTPTPTPTPHHAVPPYNTCQLQPS